MATNRNSDYAVGYGKPPRHTRFPNGRSGNPKGRPKGSKNSTTLFLEALGEEVVVSENGRRKKITKREAIVKQLVNKAASGDHRSIQLVLLNLIPLLEARIASARSAATEAEALPAPSAEQRKARALEIAKILREVGYLAREEGATAATGSTSDVPSQSDH